MLVDVGGIYNILWSPVNDESKQIEKKIKIRNVKNTSEEIKKVIICSHCEGSKTSLKLILTECDGFQECDKTLKSEYPSEYVLSDLMLAIFKLKSNVPLHPHFTNSLKTEKEFRNKHISKKSAKRWYRFHKFRIFVRVYRHCFHFVLSH